MIIDLEATLAEIWEILQEWRDANPEGSDANDKKWNDVCGAMANIREAFGLEDEVIRENRDLEDENDALLQFVTRYVWSKPDLTDHQIVEVIRHRPDVLERRDQWGRIAEDNDDQHTLALLAAVQGKRQ